MFSGKTLLITGGTGSFGNAVRTNVIGTDNVLQAAVQHGIKKVLCLSTDKAVYPINAMGISKAMMEKVMMAKSRTVTAEKTTICGSPEIVHKKQR